MSVPMKALHNSLATLTVLRRAISYARTPYATPPWPGARRPLALCVERLVTPRRPYATPLARRPRLIWQPLSALGGGLLLLRTPPEVRTRGDLTQGFAFFRGHARLK